MLDGSGWGVWLRVRLVEVSIEQGGFARLAISNEGNFVLFVFWLHKMNWTDLQVVQR